MVGNLSIYVCKMFYETILIHANIFDVILFCSMKKKCCLQAIKFIS